MSDSQPLQFDHVEYASTPAATACAHCRQPIVQSYYDLDGKFICSNCHYALTQGNDGAGRGLRIGRSLMAGLGAAILGALIWWGVRKLTGFEVGLVSIGIGIAVGKAVRWGSNHRGGWAYQLMAILLTYGAVTMNYLPDVVEGLMKNAAAKHAAAAPSKTAAAPKATAQKASAAAPADEDGGLGTFLLGIAALIAIAAAAPFLAGAENIIGILIIAFGLYEAWKINKRTPLTFTGPFSVAPAAPPPANV